MKIINLIDNAPGPLVCAYEHGLSFYIEAAGHKLLMDTGASSLFLENARQLGIDLKQVDSVILSHGHYDHAGGLLDFAQINPQAKIYLKDSAAAAYYHVDDKDVKYIGIDRKIVTLPQCVWISGDLKIDDCLFVFSNVSERKYWPKSNLLLKQKIGNVFVQDNFAHEQYLVIQEKDKHVLLSGCAHNGILNILQRYQELNQRYPDVVISGFHMMQPSEYTQADIATIEHTAYCLRESQAVFYTGHCTGKRAYALMKAIMGEQLKQIHSGMMVL